MVGFGLILLAYLIGSIPTAYIVGRVARNIDIRRYGSGNVGASNVWIHVSRWIVVPLSAFDLFVKGTLPVYFAQHTSTEPWVHVASGLSAVVGHNWSIYLKFTGGRGVTVACGVLLVLAWKELMVLLAVGIAGWLIFRSSAVWVGISMALIPAWSLVLGESLDITVLSTGLVVTLATKRILSNRGTALGAGSMRKVLLQRLIYDRDVSSRDEWVYRTPPYDQ